MFRFDYYDADGKILTTQLNSLMKVASRPSIPPAEEIIESTTLGDGSTVHRHTGIYKEREIEMECNFVQLDKRQWNNHFSKLQSILLGNTGKLVMSDDAEHYWIVKKAEMSKSERKLWVIGSFTVTFTVEPFRYLMKCLKPSEFTISNSNKIISITNDYRESYPVWRLEGSELISKVSIKNTQNAQNFVINNPFTASDNTVEYTEIDTDKGTVLQYFSDGTYENITVNSEGYFDDIVIPNGDVSYLVDFGSSYSQDLSINIKLYERLCEF